MNAVTLGLYLAFDALFTRIAVAILVIFFLSL